MKRGYLKAEFIIMGDWILALGKGIGMGKPGHRGVRCMDETINDEVSDNRKSRQSPYLKKGMKLRKNIMEWESPSDKDVI